jgi:glycosyltransferase involved in cell wall biosynthesis
VRVAFFSPLPPERTGIGDYSYELLEHLRERLDVTAVVANGRLAHAEAPEGVPIVGASDVDVDRFDCAIYQMGNNSKFHRFVFEHALARPGILVMHDPSLADFHAEICSGATSVVFQDEVLFDSPGLDALDLPRVEIGRGLRDLDRMRVLLARRIVGTSVRTLVNSEAIAAEYRSRYPGSDVYSLRLPAQVVYSRGTDHRPPPGSPVRIGVFGGINYYKRVRSALDAFIRFRSEQPDARLVIAGRPDDTKLEAELRRRADQPDLRDAVEFATDLTLDDLEQEMARCDIAVQLRWPTAGEMSATLMRTFGAGRPAVVTDLPQFADLDPAFCWRIPHEEELEVDALLGMMRRVAADPGQAWDSGQRAREFVEREATYARVADAYTRHVEECASIRRAVPPSNFRTALADPKPGVNVVRVSGGRAETREAAEALATRLMKAGVDAVVVDVDVPRVDLEPPSQRPRPPKAIPWPPPNRHAARRLTTAWSAERGPYEIDVIVVDEAFAPGLYEYAVRERRRERVVVAFVAPDAMPVIEPLLRLLNEVDSIWSASTFGANVVQMFAPSDVLVVSLLGSMTSSRAVARNASDSGCRFACVVDATSGFERSNAAGILEAFGHGFPFASRRAGVDLRLIVTGSLPPLLESWLWKRVSEVGADVVRVDSTSERREAVSECDVLVAAHRSDPFGLVVAEAMADGVVCIVTDSYGAVPTTDVRAAVRVAGIPDRFWRGDLYLEPEYSSWHSDGQMWAAVDRDELAARMRQLADDGDRRRALACVASGILRSRSDDAVIRSNAVALHPRNMGTLRERTLARGDAS